jgi:hypothetical protein
MNKSNEEGIPVLRSPQTSYELSVSLYGVMHT